jgi:hypothetical protein
VSTESRPFTVGDTILNPNGERLRSDTWAHEKRHTNQWAVFGGWTLFPLAWAIDESFHGGFRSCGWLEQSAGCRRGHYS